MRRSELKRGTGLKPMSESRREELAALGITHPTSTLVSKRAPEKPKAPRNTGPKRSVADIVKARSGGRCEFPACVDAGEHLHHRRPRRMGGSRAAATNGAANLVHLCSLHHTWIESRRAIAITMGLLLPAGADPCHEPVWTRHSDQPVYLTDSSWIPFEEACA